MSNSQNGWPGLIPASKLLHRWTIPTRSGDRDLTLRQGSAGFLLCHIALTLSDEVEPIATGPLDDWGYAYREVRDGDDLSNHASGTAVDLNALRHPLGRDGTFTDAQVDRVHTLLKRYRGTVRWGGDYSGRVDEMHFELVEPLPVCESVARRLLASGRGRRVLAANPGQRAVILS